MLDRWLTAAEETREAFKRQGPRANRVKGAAGAQPLAGPAFDGLTQPWLADRCEAHRAPAAGGSHTQLRCLPGVGAVATIELIARGRRDRGQHPARVGAHVTGSLPQAPDRVSSARRSSTSRWM